MDSKDMLATLTWCHHCFWGLQKQNQPDYMISKLLLSLVFGSVTYLTYFQFSMFQAPIPFINLLFHIISSTLGYLLTIANS